MGGRGSGRRGRFTPEVCETILRALKAGAFKKHAAMGAGISRDTLDDWLKRGQAGHSKYAAFARDVEVAIAQDFIRSQSIVTRAAVAGDWKAAAWNLEVKAPDCYGRRRVAVGVALEGERPGEEPEPRVTFYLPTNGRRPDDDDADA